MQVNIKNLVDEVQCYQCGTGDHQQRWEHIQRAELFGRYGPNPTLLLPGAIRGN